MICFGHVDAYGQRADPPGFATAPFGPHGTLLYSSTSRTAVLLHGRTAYL